MADQTTSKRLYDLLVTKNFDIQALDSKTGRAPANEQGQPDINEADEFRFDFTSESNKNYGSVVVLLGDDNDLTMFFGDTVGKTMEGTDKKEWFDFLYQMKQFATKNFLTFSPENITKLKYTKQGQAAIKEGLFESWQGRGDLSWNGNTTEARLLIKHKKKLGESDARFRYIESIYVETAEGERFKLKSRSLTAGKAMLEHVRQGGNPYDARGQHINEIVEELSVLSRFRRANSGKILEGDTKNLVEQTDSYYKNMHSVLKHLGTQRGYQSYFESWSPATVDAGNLVVEDLKNLFVTQTIDHRIEEALPLLARITQEANSMKEAQIFESWINRLVEGTWAIPETPEQKQTLVDLMSKDFPVGPDATNATEQLYDVFGDDELFDRLQELADADANADARSVVMTRMQELSDNPDVEAVIGQLQTTNPDGPEPDAEELEQQVDGDEQLPQSVEEGIGGIGNKIKALYQKIYNAGDDEIEYFYQDSPIFAQYWDEYEGDLDSIIAEVDPGELQVMLDELESYVQNANLAEGDVAKLAGITALGIGAGLGANYLDQQAPRVEFDGKNGQVVRAYLEPAWTNRIPDNAMTIKGKDGKTYHVWSSSGKGMNSKSYHAAPVEPVKEDVAEGWTKLPNGNYRNMHTGVQQSKPPVKKKRGEKTGAEWDAIEKAKKDKEQGVAEGTNDTVYPNAEVIKSRNGKPVGEIYQDENGWGAFHYRADRGYDLIDSREEAIEALKDLHQETGRSRPDYTIKGVAEGSEQIYNILALDKGNALKKPTKLKWKASSLEDIFDALAAQDWYPLEINGVEVIAGKRLKQGVAEVSSNTLKRYKKAAQRDIDTTDNAGLYTDSDIDRMGRRMKGIDQATSKINANKRKEQGVAEGKIHVGYRNSSGDWIKTTTHDNYRDAKAAMERLVKAGKKGVQHRYDNKGNIDPGAMMTARPDSGVAEGQCNMTAEGEYCPEHGLEECGIYEYTGNWTNFGLEESDQLTQLKRLALGK